MTSASPHGATHVVLNPVPPFEDVNLFETNAALRDAVKFNQPGLATDALSELGTLVATGKLKYRETVAQGIANAPDAFFGLLKGKNQGKQLVKLA